MNSPGQNIGMGSLPLLQGIFPTQGSDPGLAHCGRILYQLSQKGIPGILEWVSYSFSGRSSPPRNQTRVSCIAGGFFTNWAIREAHAYQGTWKRGGSRQLPWSLIGDTVRSSYNIMSRVEAQINLSHRLCKWGWFQTEPWMINSCFHYHAEGQKKYVPGLGSRVWSRMWQGSEVTLCSTYTFKDAPGGWFYWSSVNDKGNESRGMQGSDNIGL